MAIKKDELDTWLESLNTMYHGTVKTSTRTSIRIVNSPVIKELLNIKFDEFQVIKWSFILTKISRLSNQQAKKFTFKKMAKHYLKIYNKFN